VKVIKLTPHNVEALVLFEKEARLTEPDVFTNDLNANLFYHTTCAALLDTRYKSAKCLLCVTDCERVIGRIDFSLLPSFAFGGEIRAYVDWIYVLKNERNKGVGRFLFQKMGEQLNLLGVTEYFLHTASNEDAHHFYNKMQNAKITKQTVLTVSQQREEQA